MKLSANYNLKFLLVINQIIFLLFVLQLIASLKGLSNVHKVTDEVAVKLTQCALDKTVKTRIRVAALDVFHSDAGNKKVIYCLIKSVAIMCFYKYPRKINNYSFIFIKTLIN